MKYGKIVVFLGVFSAVTAISHSAFADSVCTQAGGSGISEAKALAADDTDSSQKPSQGTSSGAAEGRHHRPPQSQD